jgi:membrane protease YdiL (CAAX protease family)
MNNQNNEHIPDLQQVGFILLMTLLVIFVFFFATDFLGDTPKLLFNELLIITPALIYVMRRKWSMLRTFRLLPVTSNVALASLFVFVPVFILMDEIDRLIQTAFPMPEAWLESLLELMQFNTPWQTAALVIAALFVAPIGEEMLFRGLVQRSLEHFREPAIAIVLTAVLFALVHFNPWTAIQVMLLGLVFGYMTWKSGSILPSIIAHSLNNLASLLLINSRADSLNWYATNDHVRLSWIILAALILVPAFRFFKASVEKKKV